MRRLAVVAVAVVSLMFGTTACEQVGPDSWRTIEVLETWWEWPNAGEELCYYTGWCEEPYCEHVIRKQTDYHYSLAHGKMFWRSFEWIVKKRCWSDSFFVGPQSYVRSGSFPWPI